MINAAVQGFSDNLQGAGNLWKADGQNRTIIDQNESFSISGKVEEFYYSERISSYFINIEMKNKPLA
ncbi:MAG: hypothetical protein LBH19_10915 [Dysgonamonadaceae bacterium]|jgi:hypothetical protein|nr:hypothetical protein [Dysgonamonadaceae bacterium]